MIKIHQIYPDETEGISTLAHIFQLEPSSLMIHDVEHFIKVIGQYFSHRNILDHNFKVLSLLESIENKGFIIMNSYKIYGHNRWFCALTVLCSLKNFKQFNNWDIVLRKAIRIFKPSDQFSIYLLQLIVYVIGLSDIKLESKTLNYLLQLSHTIALSPLKCFRHYANSISKKALTRSQLENVDLGNLPFKGISIIDINICWLKSNSIDKILMRIIEMFLNNIENREGGILYKTFLDKFDINFEQWKTIVWNEFYKMFIHIDYDSEFYQSLLKYWIPLTVSKYQLNLYNFAYHTSIPKLLKAHILLESRKRGHLIQSSIKEIQFLNSCFKKQETCFVALQIIGCPVKKGKIPPDEIEFKLLQKYLNEKTEILSSNELKIIQIYLVRLKDHLKFLNELFRQSTSLLQGSRSDLGAQILVIFCKTIDLSNSNNEFMTRYLESNNIQLLIEHKLLTEIDNNEFSKLAVLILKNLQIFVNGFPMKFIDNLSPELSIQVSNQVRNVYHAIASINFPQDNVKLVKDIYTELNNIFRDNDSFEATKLFKAVLLFDALNQLSKYYVLEECSQWIWHVALPNVANLLQSQISQKQSNQSIKIIEALYNNICEFCMENMTLLSGEESFSAVIHILVNVIQNSSMRRPTTISATLLKHIFCVNESSLHKLKICLMNITLEKLNFCHERQSLTLRKNPESRLIIHALCSSDFTPQKTFLQFSLNYLINLLTNDSCPNATVASTINCIEILMSDNDLYEHTLKFAPRIILLCVQHFSNRNWIVRNACAQLEKALIDRFLGVKIGLNNRAKNLEDLFQIFPQLIRPFVQMLQQNPLNDSAIAVMQFFIESQWSLSPFRTEVFYEVQYVFLKIFQNFIKENSSLYGTFASRAYISLCPEKSLPYNIENVIQFIRDNFKNIQKKHTIRNFILVLKELYRKYTEKPRNSQEYSWLHYQLSLLTNFLQTNFHLEQFDFLLFKVLSLQDVIKQLENFKKQEYFLDKVWLHNYIPFIAFNNSLAVLPHMILSEKIPECLQIKVLQILLKRSLKEDCSATLKMLIFRGLNGEFTSKYLQISHFKLVLFIFEQHSEIIEFCDRISLSFDVENDIFKIFICLLILSKQRKRSPRDLLFIKRSVRIFESCLFSADDDFIEIFDEMLKYLYQMVTCVCDKKRLLNMALILILEYGLYNLISFILNISIPNSLSALTVLLDDAFLRNELKRREKKLAEKQLFIKNN
ncbi:hypothetical protein ABEB36_007904 [Hypothenemus hampei]|uniref:DUF2428 domain-containing protein n=1 Tax=Hypothenemus hampei TaxID=57062 RepID=A0ABD1EY09_HYPHA